MADVTLLPCPFCGGESERATVRRTPHEEFPEGITQVRCKVCLIITPMVRKSEAIALWNTRPALTPKQAAADEMFEALENCAELLNVAMERLGVCGEGDSGQRRADAEFPGGVAALHAARAALAKAGQP